MSFRLWTGVVLACLALPGCGPQSPDAPGSSAQAAPRDETAWREMEAIERREWAHPKDSDTALRAIQERVTAGSAEQLQAFTLRLTIAVRTHHSEHYEYLMRELEQWPDGPLRRAADIELASARASMMRERGDLRSARKALPTINADTDAQVPPLVLLRAYGVQATILAETSAADRAIASGLEALRLAEQSGSVWRRVDARNELAWCYWRAQQFDKAREANAQAIREGQSDPSPALMFRLYNNRGIFFAEDPDRSIAQRSDTAALSFARQSGDATLLARAVGNSSDYYLRTGNFRRALELAGEGLELARSSGDAEAEIVSLLNQGEARIGLHQLREGKQESLQALAMLESRGSLRYAAEYGLEFGNALEAAGDYAGAIEALLNYRRQISQLMQDDTRKAILEAQEQFEDQRRAREMDLLNRDNRLAAEQLRAQGLETRLWLALAGCVTVSALLLALAYHRVRRTNRALAATNHSLKLLSERDPLTGLSNRRHLQAAIKVLARSGTINGSLFLVDIDHFKRINDQYGHSAGDAVLVEVARRLRAASREEDLIVRWGGEEFLIVVGSPSPLFARDLAQRVLDQISVTPVAHERHAIAVTASLGYASFPLQPHGLELPWERAIDLVDTLMYMAKARGRNRACGVDSVDARNVDELRELSAGLGTASEQGRVVLDTLHGPERFLPQEA